MSNSLNNEDPQTVAVVWCSMCATHGCQQGFVQFEGFEFKIRCWLMSCHLVSLFCAGLWKGMLYAVVQLVCCSSTRDLKFTPTHIVRYVSCQYVSLTISRRQIEPAAEKMDGTSKEDYACCHNVERIRGAPR